MEEVRAILDAVPSWLKNGPALVTFVGAIITAFGIFWSASRQAETARQLRQKTDQIADLNRELTVRSTETLNQITGGDSFIYFEPLKRGGRLGLYMRHAGKYPAFDVTLRFHENGEILAQPRYVGTVRRGSGFDWITFEPLVLPERPEPGDTRVRKYNIEISTRNGIFVQDIEVKPVKGEWHTDSRKLRRAGGDQIPLPASFREAQEQS